MCRKLICLICLASMPATYTAVQAEVFRDDFEIPYDYITEGIAKTGWDGFTGLGQDETVNALDASTDRAGQLYIESSNSWWEDGFSPMGPFLYKIVTGDFVATVEVTDFAGEEGAVIFHNDSFLMARVPNPDDAGPGEDFECTHYFPTWVGNMGRDYNNGSEAEWGFTGDGFNCAPHIQLERVNNTFYFRKSFDGQTWTELAGSPVTREDFDGLALQVGLGHSMYSTETGYVAFDNFRLESPEMSVGKAALPNPSNGATNLPRDISLSWKPGDYAVSHDVYFGGNFANVSNGTGGTFRGNQTQDWFLVGSPGHPYPGGLTPGTTYYWRIDEVEINGGIHVGDVWSFTIASVPVRAGHSVQNPVIYDLADSGVMKYNGEYYIMGNWLSGDMMSSENLVNWGQRVHVFSMNNDWATGEAGEDREIHACDLRYVDGVFHLYWSVNRADIGVRHIGHAITTDDPMNYYTEPVTSTWFANYIDAHLFIDYDASPYFYTVKFPVGNVVLGQPMSDPWELRDYDHTLITSIPGTWENQDGRINEGPFVVKYRDKYYMLYCANHTRCPCYAVGCVESNGPLAFNNNDKYPYPVLEKLSRGGHTVTHCGQPSLVRGPNGFEWWIVYFAVYDGSTRSQAVDRVFFFDRKLYVDGPTSNLSSFTGVTYSPPPSAPTLLDLFNEGTKRSLAVHWDIKAGSWDISSDQARQTLAGGSDNKAIIRSAPARNYLVEANVKLTDGYPSGEKAGVTAYYKDGNNWMIVALDQKNGSWCYNKLETGIQITNEYALPGGFDFNVYHNIRVTKNDTNFYVELDGRPAPSNPFISTDFADEGLPGLYCQKAHAHFDGFIYTVGWDEYDEGITGWGIAESGTLTSGSWRVSTKGIEAQNTNTTNRIYKGDLLGQYDFMTQLTRTSSIPQDQYAHTMGIYPVYIDENNWMIACIDLVSDRLKVYGKNNGNNLGIQEVPLYDSRTYNLRVVKRDDATRIFVDGELKITIIQSWGPSQVGLVTERIRASYNGITLFKLGSQYGNDAPTNPAMSDNFDDCIFSSKWQQVSIHDNDIEKHDHDTLPDIVIHESDRCLRFSGCEKGDDSSPWYGRGLKYTESVFGDSEAEFDFDSLCAYSEGTTERAAIGLRIWKNSQNWFEVKQIDNADGDSLFSVAFNNGIRRTSSVPRSASTGNLRIKFTNSSGLVEYFLNDVREGSANLSGMKNSNYYIYITAYTSNDGNRIMCTVDNFKIIKHGG